MRRLRVLALPLLVGLLGGCQTVVLNPSGDVGRQEADLLVWATILILLIIIPVMALTAWFAWRYRHTNKKARYEPEWEHSIHLELVIWSAPLLIIIALGSLTWVGTHLLDPYRPLDRIRAGVAVNPAVEPLQVEVVALDWKWLFIYPQYGVATINSVAAPVDRPVEFRITASSVMNSLSIPALAGQVYAMPSMETQLHAVANVAGDYPGFSANYSGPGFAGMKFLFHAMPQAGFDQWIERLRAGGGVLHAREYEHLVAPSENDPVQGFADVDPNLYHAILMRSTGALAAAPAATSATEATQPPAPMEDHR